MPCVSRFVVHGLVQGDIYTFRVQAVNAYGLSDESQESDPLFVDAALSKCATPQPTAERLAACVCRTAYSKLWCYNYDFITVHLLLQYNYSLLVYNLYIICWV